ncbi:MAG TPA: hypothetical protein PKK06_15410 [Phycisphaerae bacterium]|nr:hypothetical protein [Phycisphaerae bacterium]HNU46721.1 hypothetical protein [Phycisphaerae bacterium]
MKLVLMFLLLVGVGLLVYFLGVRSYDPSQQGRDAKSKIAPGMTWQQVTTAIGEPKRFCVYVSRGVAGEAVLEPSVPMKFTPSVIQQRLDDGKMADGFLFTYIYSRGVAFDVIFDDTGVATHVKDRMTEADLLQMKDR